jgi:hypothetical protein
MSWHLNKPSQINVSSRQQTAPSATVAPITRILCSTTPATWFSTHSLTRLIYVDHTPDPSQAVYSSSVTKTILPESMDPSTFFFTIIPCVVASAGEAEYAALLASGQHAASLRTTLCDMGYPQDPTIIICDNTSAIGIATDSIKQKRSKAVDIHAVPLD